LPLLGTAGEKPVRCPCRHEERAFAKASQGRLFRSKRPTERVGKRLSAIIKRRVRASQHFRSFWGAWRTIAGYEAIHMIRKGQRAGVRRERRSVYCTNSFSVCSLRRAKFPIIYPDFQLDYKVATHPFLLVSAKHSRGGPFSYVRSLRFRAG
jgi:hypothetical protein